ncbi:NADH-quinone oxidoreductase subunit NuoN [Tistrella bauzanensis]|uniref:NADH-quinone oxidoreductase subunit N n=1 Tax=Tistrella arctica TaxID=3133430 RepID=A0ABU9YHJ2_9PROT
MTSYPLPDLAPAFPELWLAVLGMALILVGVFAGKDKASGLLSWLAGIGFAIAAVLVMMGPEGRVVTFHGLFVTDAFGAFMKVLVLLASIFALIMSRDYLEREGVVRFEYPLLMVFATIGMLMMISANDLMSLYMGLELQSLSLYVLAAFKRDSVKSTEAGLKYFLLGALSSGMLLYGCSMVYGFAGSTSFDALAVSLAAPAPSLGVIVGLVFIMVGLAFKISAVPFHMWTPDVYEGAPTSVAAFFAMAPKIAAMALLVRVLAEPFGGMVGEWQQVTWFIAVASMVLAAFAAIGQTNIKRLLAYSSIGHVGYALVGLTAGTVEGYRGVAAYMAIYLFMTVGTFSVVLLMRRQGRMVEQIADLAGLSRSRPVIAFILAAMMFSLAGIPPLAGFFGKLFVFQAAVKAGLFWLAVIGVVSSVVSAYYYLRIVKIMYFDEPAEAFDRGIGTGLTVTLAISFAFTMLFFIVPGVLLDRAGQAALALMP